ncbi:DoxX family membrane protein [Streptomyces thermospinosisporus]|uniref:DoxX family membrane protein n=1 Tax=Streptomyces thermospinosisporus TaxID=161482 RepID=A0ABP4JNP5_9ACTN
MSVDTRTPRTPTGDRSSGLDDAPALSMVKVPSDPAQIIVNHASFRVQLGASSRRAASPRIARYASAVQGTARVPVVTTMGAPGRTAPRRRPVVWSGRSAPDDTDAHRLLQAVRQGGVRHSDEPQHADSGATQVIPRVGTGHQGYGYDENPAERTLETPVIGAQRTQDSPLLPPMRTVGSAYDEPAYAGPGFENTGAHDTYDTGAHDYDDQQETGEEDTGRRSRRHGDDPARHAYYPGRRMNLGVVLLPLRVVLGFVAVYAGMGKLCDPHYFDGERGSLVTWLNSLHPWEIAAPLHQFALHHPIGTGLGVAFLQIAVGVLTVLGCWQRVAAALGVLLSAGLLVAVSWKSSPVYDTTDILFLAAWSPLVVAGAPVYSVDGRLAGSAWRRLGPRADIWDLRRYVLRRGALITALVCGVSLLTGAILGGAVRDADRVVVPGPGESPRNELPGSPLPKEPGERKKRTPSASTSPSRGGATSGATSPSAGAGTPQAPRNTGGAVTGAPSQTQGSAGQAPPQQSSPAGQAPSTGSGGPTSSGGTGSGGTGTPSGGSEGSDEDRPGLVGGLLG